MQSGAQLAEHAPADIIETLVAEQQAREAAGAPAGLAAPGTALPDGALLDAHGAPTTVVVDGGGTIRWIDVYSNYTGRSEVSDILAAVDAPNS